MDIPPPLSPLDPSTYEWTQAARSTGQWRRPALSGEALWIPRAKDYHEMFIGGSLTLETFTSSSALTVAVKATWRRLRFEVPELAVSAGYGTDGKSHMQYQVPSDDEEVNQWVERTTRFEDRRCSLTFQAVLDRIRPWKVGHDADQVFLLIHPVVERYDDLVKQVNFMLNADHQIIDGISIRILLGRFLKLLAESLSSPSEEAFDWEESTKNLTPPWIGLLNDGQLLSGPEYERVAAAKKDIMFQKMPQNPGLPLLSISQTRTQKTHFITLTKPQSSNLLQTIKHTIGSESNVTHLGHAAMVLALLRAYPPGPHSQTLYSPCWLNGRRYLKPSPKHPEPTRSYLPICQSFAPVIFEDLNKLVLCRSARKDGVRDMLVKACNIATREYGKIRRAKSMLPECVVLFEKLGESTYLHMKQQQEAKSSNDHVLALRPPSPIPNGGMPHRLNSFAKHPVEEPPAIRTADPLFLSDGITEQYIDHEYFDNSASPSRKKMFEVDDIMFAANAEKNLIVRMSSWRGKITVSGEWKECDYDGDMIVNFLEDLVEIMLSLINQD